MNSACKAKHILAVALVASACKTTAMAALVAITPAAGLQCDVSNINNITKNILAQQKIKATNTSSYSYNKTTKTFNRKYQPVSSAKAEFNKLKNKDKAVFNGATYTSIYRFESFVTSTSNPSSNTSKSKKAVMLKSSIMDLINGKINVSNQIQLSK
ncbi:MAG: hypothetical protein EOO96_17815 [Pedobacter sp.]|nr:MAG: hypothetical protein EOO96_17815 [Pedobacter sp.]